MEIFQYFLINDLGSHLLLTRTMTNLFTPIILVIVLFACNTSNKTNNGQTLRNNTTEGDTLYLETGLKLVFTKKSDDTVKVLPKRMIKTHINLYANSLDNKVWSTHEGRGMPMDFQYTITQMISGFDEAMKYTMKGDRIMAVIPPELGYGAAGRAPAVPPNATLYFDIEVVDVR